MRKCVLRKGADSISALNAMENHGRILSRGMTCLFRKLSLATMWRAESMEAKPETEPAEKQALWSRQQLMRAEIKTVRWMG